MWPREQPSSVDQALGTVALFAGASRRQWRAITSLCTSVRVAPPRRLASTAVTAPQLVVVIEGAVALCRGGRRDVVIGPGGWFGHEPLLRGALTDDTTAVVVVAGLVAVYSRREFAALVAAWPELRRRLEAATTTPAGSERIDHQERRDRRTLEGRWSRVGSLRPTMGPAARLLLREGDR